MQCLPSKCSFTSNAVPITVQDGISLEVEKRSSMPPRHKRCYGHDIVPFVSQLVYTTPILVPISEPQPLLAWDRARDHARALTIPSR